MGDTATGYQHEGRIVALEEKTAVVGVKDRVTKRVHAQVAAGLSGKRLRYGDLIADNVLESGART